MGGIHHISKCDILNDPHSGKNVRVSKLMVLFKNSIILMKLKYDEDTQLNVYLSVIWHVQINITGIRKTTNYTRDSVKNILKKLIQGVHIEIFLNFKGTEFDIDERAFSLISERAIHLHLYSQTMLVWYLCK